MQVFTWPVTQFAKQYRPDQYAHPNESNKQGCGKDPVGFPVGYRDPHDASRDPHEEGSNHIERQKPSQQPAKYCTNNQIDIISWDFRS